jgi:ubiquinone/menaquinone biosynthesis C-methylase UbiE/DNA-binding transcriptional ArsR family regulator
MNSRPPAILDHLASLADTTRSRILLLLDRHELTVSELCGIMQLPQSTVSRHLKALADSGWISARAEGTSHLYTMTREELDGAARRLWLLVREHVGPSAAATQDQRRLQATLAERRTKSQEFFSSSVGQWDRVRDELFGDRFHLAALAAFADRAWVVGDLGCGTGTVSAALAPFVARVVAVDGSAPMLQAAKKRLQQFDNVDLRRGELESLPIDDGRLDAATLMLVLHHVPEPDRALAEALRVLRPGGARRARRHAAARSRQLSAADGSRVARVQRRAHAAAVEQQRIRGRENRFIGAGRESQRSGIVCRDGKKATKTRKRESGLVRSAAFSRPRKEETQWQL